MELATTALPGGDRPAPTDVKCNREKFHGWSYGQTRFVPGSARLNEF
ncbi:MAG: hypothetical protein ACM37W_25915 [Actinomycetota bacterium]